MKKYLKYSLLIASSAIIFTGCTSTYSSITPVKSDSITIEKGCDK